MPPRRYVLVPQAGKDLERIPAQARRRAFTALDRFVADPGSADTKKLSGRGNILRLRFGDYRILFEYQDNGETVVVLRVLHRSSAYRD